MFNIPTWLFVSYIAPCLITLCLVGCGVLSLIITDQLYNHTRKNIPLSVITAFIPIVNVFASVHLCFAVVKILWVFVED